METGFLCDNVWEADGFPWKLEQCDVAETAHWVPILVVSWN